MGHLFRSGRHGGHQVVTCVWNPKVRTKKIEIWDGQSPPARTRNQVRRIALLGLGCLNAGAGDGSFGGHLAGSGVETDIVRPD